jgi:hypothetical protein
MAGHKGITIVANSIAFSAEVIDTCERIFLCSNKHSSIVTNGFAENPIFCIAKLYDTGTKTIDIKIMSSLQKYVLA